MKSIRGVYKGSHKSIRGSMTSVRELYRIYEGMHVMCEGIHEIANKYIMGSMKSIRRFYKGIHGICVGNLR